MGVNIKPLLIQYTNVVIKSKKYPEARNRYLTKTQRAKKSYHYRCKNCGYDFTEQQSFNDDPITVCPKCSQEQVRKVYSAVPIEFKGHGFYRTDKSGK